MSKVIAIILCFITLQSLFAQKHSQYIYFIEDKKNQIVNVKNGGDAMAAYRDMMYGLSKVNPTAKEAYNAALKQYCQLDTLAMVIIWKHWQDLMRSRERVTSREEIIANIKNLKQ